MLRNCYVQYGKQGNGDAYGSMRYGGSIGFPGCEIFVNFWENHNK